LYDDDEIVGFIGVLHFPHPKNKKIKRVTRLVILPDYQGIGLGTRFLNVVADLYSKQGFDFRIVTTAKNLIHTLDKSDKWKTKRYSVSSPNGGNKKMNETLRKVKTGSFKYVG